MVPLTASTSSGGTASSRTSPGRSTSVMSGASGALSSSTIVSPLKARPRASVSAAASCAISPASAPGPSTSRSEPASPARLATQRHFAWLGAPRITSLIAQRVTPPSPRGNGTPEIASSTELLPLPCSPSTAICGRCTSEWMPCFRSPSIRSVYGLTLVACSPLSTPNSMSWRRASGLGTHSHKIWVMRRDVPANHGWCLLPSTSSTRWPAPPSSSSSPPSARTM